MPCLLHARSAGRPAGHSTSSIGPIPAAGLSVCLVRFLTADESTDYGWYGRLVGAYFSRHPEIQAATLYVEDRSHRSTLGLPERWERTDEWYDFQTNPRTEVNVLARLDEGTYTGGGMGADHPIAWWHDFDGGRAWYTAGGHTRESYREPLFLQHLLGGIQYAAGVG